MTAQPLDARALDACACQAPRDDLQVCVIVVSYQTGEVLFECLRAALREPGVSELIVVDNGNPDEVVDRLNQIAYDDRRVVILSGHGNVGFAKACNLGAAKATADRLLFLNPDSILQPGAVAAMADCGAELGAHWIVGARLINPDGSDQRGGRRGDVTLASAALEAMGVVRLGGLTGVNREQEPCPHYPEPMPVVSGACLMIPRACFQELSGFDEGYFLHVEDIDLCKRLADAGGSIYFAPKARVLHHGATSSASRFAIERHKARGLVRYFWNHANGPLDRVLAVGAAPLIYGVAMARAAARMAQDAGDEA